MPLSTKDVTNKNSSISHDIYLLAKKDIYEMEGYIRGFLENEERGIVSLLSIEQLIQENILNPNWNIWMAVDAGKLEGILPVQFISERDIQICHILAINCKNYRKYRKLLWKVEKWAFDNGCSAVRFTGSPAWDFFVKDMDYQPSAIVYEKPLAKVWGH